MESNWEFIGTDLTASYRVNTGLTGELSTVVPMLQAPSCDSGYRYSATVEIGLELYILGWHFPMGFSMDSLKCSLIPAKRQQTDCPKSQAQAVTATIDGSD
mgnify:CR=1 FL=1